MQVQRMLLPTWFLIMVSIALPVSAHEKTDVVILKNGNNITCEIKTLARGMLTVNTDSMGTVQIKWPDVKRITSKFLFTIQDKQGHIYAGSLQSAAEDGHLAVEGTEGAKDLEHLSVVQIQELGGSAWKRFSGSADLGTSFTKASDSKQVNFSGDLTYRTEHYSGQMSFNSTYGTSKGETDADRRQLTLLGTMQFSKKWLLYSQASHEHNLELQLDRRFSFLAGPGYRIAQSNRTLITAIGAAAVTRESYYGQDVLKNAEGYFGIEAQFFKLYSPKYDIVNQFMYMPNFTTIGRRRLEFNTKLRIEVLKDFFVSLTFYDSYDSKPPSETATKNDYGFTTGISWSFRK
ncbi:MAG TPA: DUF481 domain-containing protein [Acidobacteriota bacterium]|nr:DUF481 domain-containing protein [Acidobacteriota bacterium]